MEITERRQQKYYTATDLGAQLGVTTARVYQILAMHRDVLPQFLIGKRRYIRREDWEAFVEAGIRLYKQPDEPEDPDGGPGAA